MAVPPEVRLREEDPWTGQWTAIAPNRVVVHLSRFEADLNRPLEGTVYRGPDEAWGLQVWKSPPSDDLIQRSRRLHQAFYLELEEILEDLAQRHGAFVVYDLHSYNHRRDGPRQPPDDPRRNPDINLGTGSMDRGLWDPVVAAFMEVVSAAELLGRPLDVRENVRFQGGYLPRWIHGRFPRGCCLAVDVKKFYMDEWTGEADPVRVEAVADVLSSTTDPVCQALKRVA